MLNSSNLKIVLFIVLLLVSSFQILDSIASAQSLSDTIKCNPALPPNYANLPEKDKEAIRKSYTDRKESFNDKPCDVSAFIIFLKNLINFAITISIPLATGFIVYGAFQIMTAGGNSGKVDDGKKIIYAAVIGVAIALGSYIIIKAIINLIPTK